MRRERADRKRAVVWLARVTVVSSDGTGNVSDGHPAVGTVDNIAAATSDATPDFTSVSSLPHRETWFRQHKYALGA